MKGLSLSNASYRYLEKSFKEWLDVQGYAQNTVVSLPVHVRELLYYLEQLGINHIKELAPKHIEAHYIKLQERTNMRRGGGLGNAYLNKHIQALRRFSEYLRKVGRLDIPEIRLGNEEIDRTFTYLTQDEINMLFKATYALDNYKFNASQKVQEAIQGRDRAMLAVFYGCGLRRSEGVYMDVGDIDFDRSVLHVKKGKNYEERFVPVSNANRQYFQQYVYDYRPELLRGNKTDAFFISQQYGKRMQGQSLLTRIKKLQYQTEDTALIEKKIGLHTLRHAIATHLLQAGMKLESISKFLGHASLESTQIYTHVTEIPQPRIQPYNNIPNYETGRLSEDERGL